MHEWWKNGVVYQIYPRSFQDGNGDGIGDLDGIIQRLDYLQWLGVDAIWLSPIYASPMADFGYDVANYRDIEPIFGNLDDFDRLVSEAKARNIRVLLDFVPNHSSDQHEWFLESRSSRENPKRDWYIWKDANPDGSPPNNWLSVFGGSAWEWDETTGQYYLHSFLKEQPDLNWRNPEVVAEIKDSLAFWLKRGVSGFRLDVIHFLLKDDQFRDDPVNPDFTEGNPWEGLIHQYSNLQPGVYDLIHEFRDVIDFYGDNVLIGEINYSAPIEEIISFYDGKGLHLPFNFWLILLKWNAGALRDFIHSFDQAIPKGGWPNYVLGNHDRTRLGSRIGPEYIRLAAMLLLSLRGTPFIYYGEELGMLDVPIPADKVQDPWEINVPGQGRDPVRTPMLWDGTPNAGFTSGTPWLPVTDNFAEHSVEAQQQDQRSVLHLYHALLQLRKENDAIGLGDYDTLHANTPDTLIFLRSHGQERVIVALNFSGELQQLNLPGYEHGQIELSTLLDRGGEIKLSAFELRPYEGLIIRVEA